MEDGVYVEIKRNKGTEEAVKQSASVNGEAPLMELEKELREDNSSDLH